MANKTVRDVMRSLDACINASMTLDQVSDHLAAHSLTGAPVIDGKKLLLGFVSEYDCLGQLLQSAYYSDNTAMAQDVMSRKNITTEASVTLIDCANQFNQEKVNVMAVLAAGKPVGVISRGDIMRELVVELDEYAISRKVN